MVLDREDLADPVQDLKDQDVSSYYEIISIQSNRLSDHLADFGGKGGFGPGGPGGPGAGPKGPRREPLLL